MEWKRGVRVRDTVVARIADELDMKSPSGDLVKIEREQGLGPSTRGPSSPVSDSWEGDFVGFASLPEGHKAATGARSPHLPPG